MLKRDQEQKESTSSSQILKISIVKNQTKKSLSTLSEWIFVLEREDLVRSGKFIKKIPANSSL